jgi:SAM-dependent methyltransferase
MDVTNESERRFVADPSNRGQVDAWDGREGAFWTTRSERFDQSFDHIHGRFLAAAAIGPDDRVLDIGCGTGRTTRDVARLAVDGSALGVDLSSQMTELARATAAAEGLENVEFRQADAQIDPFDPGAFDVVVSRMGSMFFGDPHAAFTNLHRALRPGGRLTLLTWQGISDNEWLTEFRAALAVGRQLPTPPPDVPSPFSLADPERVRSVLGAAGFDDLSFQSLHEPINFGPNLDDAFEFVAELTDWMRDGLDDVDRQAALDSLRATIASHCGDDGVSYRSATWIIQARRP